MDQTTEFVKQNSGIMGTIALVILLVAILYVVYTYLYPGDDPTYSQLLQGEADARKPVHTKGKVPAIYTGGDFTLSFWIYIDDWNYKAGSHKFLFTLGPAHQTMKTKNVLTALLTPMQNNMMVRAQTGSAGAGADAGPDITLESTMQAMLNNQTSNSMFQSTVTDAPCDIKDVPLQRWACVTIVSSGRVLDIYMDGKLSRSCVLDGVVKVPTSGSIPLALRLGESGGFGGRYSSVQMWNQQMTPDVIYGIYMMGPTQAQHNIFTDITKYLNLNVSFTGSAPGQPIPTYQGGQGPSGNPFSQLYNEAEAAGAQAYGAASQAYGSASGGAQAMYARF